MSTTGTGVTDYDDARADIARLAKACRTALRQYDGGYPIGHDAVMELHRSLTKCVPGLRRPELERMAQDGSL